MSHCKKCKDLNHEYQVVHNFKSCLKQQRDNYYRTLLEASIHDFPSWKRLQNYHLQRQVGNRGIPDLPFKSRREGGEKNCTFSLLA